MIARTRSLRVRPAHVAAVLLAFGALGGTAYGALAKGSVGTKQLVDNSVQGRDIRNGTIGAVDIAQSAVTSAKIANFTITSADVAVGSLTGTQVADRTIGASDLANGAVGSAQIADNSVTGSKIPSSAVGSTEIATNAVGASELADNSVASANIIDGQVGTADLAAGAVTTDKTAAVPAVRLVRTSAQTIADGGTALTFSEVVDTTNVFDAATNPDRITIATPGVYQVNTVVTENGTAASGDRTVRLVRTNGATDSDIATSTGADPVGASTAALSTVVALQAGDVLRVFVTNPAAAAQSVTNAQLTASFVSACAGACTPG